MKKKIRLNSIITIFIILSLTFIYLFGTNMNSLAVNNENTITNNNILNEKDKIDSENDCIDDICTKEIIECDNNPYYIDENEIEIDAVVEQEDISYDGSNSNNGKNLLGEYKGLTYYSQADSRWANVAYTATGNLSQTMKSSGCGPTAAAMIISSSKGSILPTTMANLFIENGFRTVNSGTAWSAFPFIADYFGFNEYYTTESLNTALNYLSQKSNNGTNKYYIVCSCGSGLFTSGGHYVVLTALNENTIQLYDPYQYIGKYDTASRKAAGVVTAGHNVYVSKSSFEKYANYKKFWIFSNDSIASNESNQSTTESDLNHKRYVATKSSNLNVRSNASINGSIISKLKRGTEVNVIEVNGSWSKINSPVNGWVNSVYLSSISVTNITETSSSYTTGNYKTTSNLHVRAGAGTNYKIKIYNQLTSNARLQNKKLGNYYYNGYKKGVVCSVIQVKGEWGLTKSGWICLRYCTKL